MYDIAPTVAAWRAAGRGATLAWVIETHGFSDRVKGEAVAFAADGEQAGTVLAGALDAVLADHAARLPADGPARLLDVQVGEADALAAGLACGGHARLVIAPAAALPDPLWPLLDERRPACLISSVDTSTGDAAGTVITATTVLDRPHVADAGRETAWRFGRGLNDAWIDATEVITALWPTASLTIVGAGAVVDAVAAMAGLLGWRVTVLTDADAATEPLAALAPLDKVLVVSHDIDFSGAALAAALRGEAGYVGALGSRRTQAARAGWLAEQGVTDLSRIHGPAGLDLGADSPPEIAIAILAEALAVGSGTGGASLRDRPGPIHAGR